MFGFKLIKESEYDNFVMKSVRYNHFLANKYWFNEFKFLKPIFDWISGDVHVGVARNDFNDAYLKTHSTNAKELSDMLADNSRLKNKLKYLESLAGKGLDAK